MYRFIRVSIQFLVVILITACTSPTPVEDTAAIAPISAIESNISLSEYLHRDAEHRARDVYRHPEETLAFFGVQANHSVIEIWPGGKGWYTEILAPYLREDGLLIAAHFDDNSSVPFFRNARQKFNEKLLAFPEVYDRVLVSELQAPAFVDIGLGRQVDRVLTFRNVHNWMKSGMENEVFAAMYQALKPGGILGVVEHRAKVDSDRKDMIRSGYVTEQSVIAMASDAGFVLDAKSEINANASDTKDHPKGVWTLPPSFRLGEERRDFYQNIGESDRMTLRFKKPK